MLPILAAILTLNCASIGIVSDTLRSNYHEDVIGTGRLAGDVQLTLFISPRGDTWTLVAIHNDGIACPVAAGTRWVTRRQEAQ